jgi:hypothetical protein
VKLVSAFVCGRTAGIPSRQGVWMSEASFHRVISDHLALCERNRRLEHRMPLDRYREQVDGGSMTRVSRGTPPKDEPETETVVNAGKEHWLAPDSFWDTTGERPLPEFDWDDA